MSAVLGVIGTLLIGAGVWAWIKFIRDRIKKKPLFAKRETAELKKELEQHKIKDVSRKPDKHKIKPLFGKKPKKDFATFLKETIDSKRLGTHPPKIELQSSTSKKLKESEIYDLISLANKGDKAAISKLKEMGVQY